MAAQNVAALMGNHCIEFFVVEKFHESGGDGDENFAVAECPRIGHWGHLQVELRFVDA